MKRSNRFIRICIMLLLAAFAFGTVFAVSALNKVEYTFDGGTYPGITGSGHTSIVSCTGGKLNVTVNRAEKGNSGCLYIAPQQTLTADKAPYLLFKTSASCTVKLYYKMSADTAYSETHTANSESVGMAADGEAWHKIDMSAASGYTGTVNGFMFAITSADGAYALDQLVFTDDANAYLASLDGTSKGISSLRSIEIVSAADAITEKGGTLVLTASANDGTGSIALDAEDVRWQTDSVCASSFVDEQGRLHLTGKLNGTVTATVAVESLGVQYTASKTITVSGQSDVLAATHFTYMSFGNSIWSHAKSESLGWLADDGRGMAASALEKDYVHRFIYYIEKKFGTGTVEHIYGGTLATYERAIPQNDPSFDYSSSAYGLTGYIARVAEVKPDIITIQMGENVSSGPTAETYAAAVDWFVTRLQQASPDSIIILCTSFWGGANKIAGALKAGEDCGIPVARLDDLGTGSGVYVNEALGKFEHSGVASHPGDTGMDNIAKRIYEQFNLLVTAYDPTSYTAFPKTVTISAASDAIETANGKLALGASVQPADAPQECAWSVSDTNLASVSSDGVLTAKNNGTVTVRAASLYDADVYDEMTVTITGQTLPHTLTYDQNTDDFVTGMPAADAYAKDLYTLSTTEFPVRDCYNFAGWSLTKDGAPVTVVDMTGDITVYALWEYATVWGFDTAGNTMGFLGKDAFHFKAENGVLSAIATDTDPAHGVQLTFVSPTVYIDPAEYPMLVITMSNSVRPISAPLTLRVQTESDTKTYTKPVTSTAMTTYLFDLSELSDPIVGFELIPTDIDCAVTVDEIAFSRGVTLVYDKNTDAEVTGMPEASYSEKVSTAVPTREGYTFLGWSKDAGSKLLVGENAKADTLPMTLYAVWDRNDHYEFDGSVSFNHSAHVSGITYNEETHTAYINSTGNDPVINTLSAPGIPVGETSGVMKVRMKADVDSYMQIFYTTDLDAKPSEAKSVSKSYAASDDFTVLTFNFARSKDGSAASTTWAGKLAMLRFDPLSCPGNVELDYAAFTDSERNVPVYAGETYTRESDDTMSVLVADGGTLAPQGVTTLGALYLNGDIDYTNGVVRLTDADKIELNDRYTTISLCASDYADVKSDKSIDVADLFAAGAASDDFVYCNGVLLPVMDGIFVVPKTPLASSEYPVTASEKDVLAAAASFDEDGRLVSVRLIAVNAGDTASLRLDADGAAYTDIIVLDKATLAPVSEKTRVFVRMNNDK